MLERILPLHPQGSSFFNIQRQELFMPEPAPTKTVRRRQRGERVTQQEASDRSPGRVASCSQSRCRFLVSL